MSGQNALITGAFSFTGRAIAERLLAGGAAVRTLTAHPERGGPLERRVEVFPLQFDDSAELMKHFEGVDVFYNTYWMRFSRGGIPFDAAVRNSRFLFDAARRAGVRRVVHVSIANASPNSPFAYYRGKAQVEHDLATTGLSYAVLRPTVLFGDGAVLLNNIAWLLRRFPVFAIPGDGSCRLQPVHVNDVARLALELAERSDDTAVDAAGPETYRYDELVGAIRAATRSRALLLRLPPSVALGMGRALGWALRDVLITRDELRGLLQNVLVSHQPPLCATRLSDWLTDNGKLLGRRYLSELALHYHPRGHAT